MLNKEVTGTVVNVSRQWWLKINTKIFRTHSLDGAQFPHIIKVKYIVNEEIYFKYKWLNPGKTIPKLNDNVVIVYNENKPNKAKIII